MRIIENGDPENRVACRPWGRAIITPRSLTIPSQGWHFSNEVKMSFAGETYSFEDDCSENVAYNVLWTQSASGGCWPFAVMSRNTGADTATKPITAMAFAHLAYAREEEAREMGRLFLQLIRAQPADVFLIAMIQKNMATSEEIRMVRHNAFFSFEVGFRARIPDNHRIFLKTNTVNAAITRLGYFGELSNQDVADLGKSQSRANRPCALIPG